MKHEIINIMYYIYKKLKKKKTLVNSILTQLLFAFLYSLQRPILDLSLS